MSTAVDVGSARAVLTGLFRPLFLAVAAFHSETTRSRLHPGQFHRALEELVAGADATARASGLDPTTYQLAKYAAVGLTDDLALHTDWDHAREWNRYLLEQRHFGSAFAGQQFFDNVMRLRQTLAGVQDPILREQILGALEVYYTCLRLGFRGRFRGGGAAGELEGMANGILGLLLPQGEKAVRHRVWADAYRDAPKGNILDPRRLWWWPIPVSLIVVVGLWFVFALTKRSQIDADKPAELDSGAAEERPGEPSHAKEEGR